MQQSRPYFNRAFVSGGSAFNSWQFGNHLQLLQQCSKLTALSQIIQVLKTASIQSVLKCQPTSASKAEWLPTIESPQTPGAFLTQPPDEYFETDPPLPIHTMFGFNSQEALIQTNLNTLAQPIITPDWRDTTFPLLFMGFTKEAYPQVQHPFETQFLRLSMNMC